MQQSLSTRCWDDACVEVLGLEPEIERRGGHCRTGRLVEDRRCRDYIAPLKELRKVGFIYLFIQVTSQRLRRHYCEGGMRIHEQLYKSTGHDNMSVQDRFVVITQYSIEIEQWHGHENARISLGSQHLRRY